MSTKTTFKRIALVAVAALGLGVLSVAPSSASVSGVVFATTDGTAKTLVGAYDTSTAAKVEVNYLAVGTADTATVAIALKSAPSGATTAAIAKLYHGDTRTAIGSTGGAATISGTKNTSFVTAETATGFTLTPGSANTYAGGSFWLVLDTTTAVSGATLSVGTYTYTAVLTTYTASVASVTTKDVSIVVTASATQSLVASPLYSVLGNLSATTAVATVSSTDAARATFVVRLRNAESTTSAQESVTATITGPGIIGTSTIRGKSVVLPYSSDLTVNVYSDGTAGVGTISVSTPSVTFVNQTITFYAKSPATITASVNNPVLGLGDNNSAVFATAKDANGNNWRGSLYIKASAAADALIGGSATVPVLCTYTSSVSGYLCPIKAISTGTASFVVVDESLDADADATTYAAADSAVSSAAVSVKVSNSPATSVKIAFDKATYAPGEKAYITVTPLDSTGATLQGKTYDNLFATGGITTSQSFAAQSDTLTAVQLTTSTDSSSTAPRTAGAYTYTVYMPAQGDVTITAKGGTSLPTAGQVTVTATASVVNASVDAATDAANEATDAANAATDAALAAADAADAATAAAQDASDAVAALSASVSKLISSLRAQITSLTNLVIKIQKKVKA